MTEWSRYIILPPTVPIKITYISHATVLIEWEGLRILTDPVFSQRVLLFQRKQPLKIDPSKLPPIDAVLLTHAHYDHLDLFSFKYISSDTVVIIPEGMSRAIAPYINNPIVELSTWSKFSLKPGFDICAVPAKHPGGRLFFPLRYSKCHGYVLMRNGRALYFSGDTAYMDDFLNLKRLFPIELALLDAGCVTRNWHNKKRHMGLEDMIRCWEDLGKPHLIPIHWGTFFVRSQNAHGIIDCLEEKARLNPELKEKLHILQQGASLEF